jgi:hypothetical protein
VIGYGKVDGVQMILSGARGAVAALDAVGIVDTSRWVDNEGKPVLSEIALDTAVPAGIFFLAFKGLQWFANKER